MLLIMLIVAVVVMVGAISTQTILPTPNGQCAWISRTFGPKAKLLEGSTRPWWTFSPIRMFVPGSYLQAHARSCLFITLPPAPSIFTHASLYSEFRITLFEVPVPSHKTSLHPIQTTCMLLCLVSFLKGRNLRLDGERTTPDHPWDWNSHIHLPHL